jgi:exonuclease SbcD
VRILHTSDLHLGRHFNGIPLEADHDRVLDQIVNAIIEHRVDALVIAGDIFDRASPPTSAVRQFNAFLSRVASETSAAVALIAGNHDSGDRIAAMSIMTDTKRALIRGAVCVDEKPLVLEDEHGAVAISGLPFSYEYAARECFGDEEIHTPEHVLTAQMAVARQRVPAGARWVVVAHAFVSGAIGSDSERPLARVGGIETVNPEVFSGAHYVALGHLHRPQSAGANHIRYSGSPLAFGFDEVNQDKSMNLVDLGGTGSASIQAIPFSPVRGVRVLTGKHAELMLAEPSIDFVKISLTDEVPIIDAMKRLRLIFPNACELSYARMQHVPYFPGQTSSARTTARPLDLISMFLETVRGTPTAEQERTIITSALHDIGNKDSAT